MRKATAVLTVSLSRWSPSWESGRAWSHAPECGEAADSSLAESTWWPELMRFLNSCAHTASSHAFCCDRLSPDGASRLGYFIFRSASAEWSGVGICCIKGGIICLTRSLVL